MGQLVKATEWSSGHEVTKFTFSLLLFYSFTLLLFYSFTLFMSPSLVLLLSLTNGPNALYLVLCVSAFGQAKCDFPSPCKCLTQCLFPPCILFIPTSWTCVFPLPSSHLSIFTSCSLFLPRCALSTFQFDLCLTLCLPNILLHMPHSLPSNVFWICLRLCFCCGCFDLQGRRRKGKSATVSVLQVKSAVTRFFFAPFIWSPCQLVPCAWVVSDVCTFGRDEVEKQLVNNVLMAPFTLPFSSLQTIVDCLRLIGTKYCRMGHS